MFALQNNTSNIARGLVNWHQNRSNWGSLKRVHLFNQDTWNWPYSVRACLQCFSSSLFSCFFCNFLFSSLHLFRSYSAVLLLKNLHSLPSSCNPSFDRFLNTISPVKRYNKCVKINLYLNKSHPSLLLSNLLINTLALSFIAPPTLPFIAPPTSLLPPLPFSLVYTK